MAVQGCCTDYRSQKKPQKTTNTLIKMRSGIKEHLNGGVPSNPPPPPENMNKALSHFLICPPQREARFRRAACLWACLPSAVKSDNRSAGPQLLPSLPATAALRISSMAAGRQRISPQTRRCSPHSSPERGEEEWVAVSMCLQRRSHVGMLPGVFLNQHPV